MKPLVLQIIKGRNEYLRYKIHETFNPMICPSLDGLEIYMKFPVMIEIMSQIDEHSKSD